MTIKNMHSIFVCTPMENAVLSTKKTGMDPILVKASRRRMGFIVEKFWNLKLSLPNYCRMVKVFLSLRKQEGMRILWIFLTKGVCIFCQSNGDLNHG